MKRSLLALSLFLLPFISAQTTLVFVYFKDKPNKHIFYVNPLIELSHKALERRKHLGIALNDQDAPIEKTYIQKIKNLGFTVNDASKWLNGVAVYASTQQIEQLKNEPYVHHVENFAKNPHATAIDKPFPKFSEFEKDLGKTTFDYGSALAQIEQVQLKPLHLEGYTGAGVSIAVIDTGFPSVDTGSTYERMRGKKLIKGGYNFISKNNDIYNTNLNPHGSYVLGALAGYVDGQFVGSAPDADYYLYATEIGPFEIPEEELYWIEAAEEADRIGVDVISSSLGYSKFDNPIYNYTYADMNGKTTFIARGAQIASEKGIVVLVAAGNSGASAWHYIISPADNELVFSIGAVTAQGIPSNFSSFGPNAAGSIKPDACARGSATATTINNTVTAASGTSLAAPIAAGGVACLLQSLSPSISRETVKQRLRMTASLYPNPSDQMGYGILNFSKAKTELKNNEAQESTFTVFPNPTKNDVFIKTIEEIQWIEIYDHAGRIVRNYPSSLYQINVRDFDRGVYYVKAKTDKGIHVVKWIKE